MDEDHKPFDKALHIKFSASGPKKTVRTARAAADLLGSVDWPGEQQGSAHRVALEACQDALDGHGSVAEASQAFLYACNAAGVVVVRDEESSQDDRKPFDRPLKLKPGGPTTVREVRSVKGACEVLIDWPHARRGPYYQSAREVVEAAMSGSVPVAEAREAFAALAAHAGILMDDPVS